MTTRPATSYISDNARDEGEGKQFFEDLLSNILEGPGGAAVSTKTIAAGVITPDGPYHAVDTQGAAATDDLDTAATTNHPEGRWLLLKGADAAHIVTIIDQAGGAGQFHMVDGLDFQLDTDRYILFVREGADWYEKFRSEPNRSLRVIEVTEVAASPKVLVPSDSGAYLKGDVAAAATNYATLPAATAGLRFPFGTDSAQKLRLTAAGTDTIQRAGTTSGAGGFYETAAEDGFQGAIRCWKAGQWIIENEFAAGVGAVT